VAGARAKRQPLAAGKVADITIFDPDTIASKPREPVASLPAGGVQSSAMRSVSTTSR
jgi:hypothetical protein